MRQKLSLDAGTAAPAVGKRVCPRCGLALQVIDVGERPSLRYDFPAWDRQCLFPLLGGPSACLGMQGGTLTRTRKPLAS
jgi:hypothetical protein